MVIGANFLAWLYAVVGATLSGVGGVLDWS